MDNNLIKRKIDEKYKLIEESFKPTCFVLNDKVVKLSKEIEELQNICCHNFENGQCKLCYKAEK